MPKLTQKGYEGGSSEAPVVVLGKTSYNNNQQLLEGHRDALNKVTKLDDHKRQAVALRRGNHLEPGVADWTLDELKYDNPNSNISMHEPKEAFRFPDAKMGASIDRIVDVKESPIIFNRDGEEFVFQDQGIIEIKTDFYHQDRLRPEWVIQVHHQFVCSGLDWGIVACMSQKGQLHLYPITMNENLCKVIIDKWKEFWDHIKNNTDYPPIEEKIADFVDLKEALPETNHDFATMLSNYVEASQNERKWKRTKDHAKSAIADALDGLQITHGKYENYEVVSEMIEKTRTKQVQTDEKYESHKFSVKEKIDD